MANEHINRLREMRAALQSGQPVSFGHGYGEALDAAIVALQNQGQAVLQGAQGMAVTTPDGRTQGIGSAPGVAVPPTDVGGGHGARNDDDNTGGAYRRPTSAQPSAAPVAGAAGTQGKHAEHADIRPELGKHDVKHTAR